MTTSIRLQDAEKILAESDGNFKSFSQNCAKMFVIAMDMLRKGKD